MIVCVFFVLLFDFTVLCADVVQRPSHCPIMDIMGDQSIDQITASQNMSNGDYLFIESYLNTCAHCIHAVPKVCQFSAALQNKEYRGKLQKYMGTSILPNIKFVAKQCNHQNQCGESKLCIV